MRKILFSIFAALLIISCNDKELALESVITDTDLYGSIENIDATKTSMDQNNNVLWSEGDQLVAFMKTTLGSKYQIKEQYVGTNHSFAALCGGIRTGKCGRYGSRRRGAAGL